MSSWQHTEEADHVDDSGEAGAPAMTSGAQVSRLESSEDGNGFTFCDYAFVDELFGLDEEDDTAPGPAAVCLE